MPSELALREAIYNCRAMRRLKTDEVPEDVLIELISAANQAPPAPAQLINMSNC